MPKAKKGPDNVDSGKHITSPSITVCSPEAPAKDDQDLASHGISPAGPCVVVIFGASGDLAKRKLIPSLYNLKEEGLLPEDFAILGVARSPMDDQSFRKEMSDAITQFATREVDKKIWKEFQDRLFYQPVDYADAAGFKKLRERLESFDERFNTGGNYLYYLSIPPEIFETVVHTLGETGLINENDGKWRRVIVEKPFGHDYDSAVELDTQLSAVLKESQTYRIDHYLGKETVQNLLVFRFGNGIFEPVWNRRYIDHIQITVAENIGVDQRGAFYESAGALRDVTQNHMLMLLSLIAMEPPTSLQGESVRREKTKLLEAVKIMSPEEVLKNTVRGQYSDGIVNGEKVKAYRSEKGVNPKSNTETYAALKLFIENWRWAGVPFYLRTGKRMATRSTQIVIQFREAPLPLYQGERMGRIGPNRLIVQIQPCEGITLQVRAKTPGPTMRTEAVGMNFNYSDLGASASTGYETLLYDCMMGDATLFHRIDAVLNSWKVVAPILDVWNSLPPRDFPNYKAGTWGPDAARQLIEADGHEWWEPNI